MRGNGVGRLIESFFKNMSPSEALEYLFENASDALCILDTHGKFVAVNRKTEELTGFKREEIAKKLEVFSARLKRLLGSEAPVIERLILKNLYRKLQLEFEEKEGYEFSDYITEMKENCGC